MELLDDQKTYLSSFGGGLWNYAGYGARSGDGDHWGAYWNQEDTTYSTVIRVPAAGAYYLRTETETNVPDEAISPVTLVLKEQGWWGNPVPLRNAMMVALFFGSALLIAPVGRDYDD